MTEPDLKVLVVEDDPTLAAVHSDYVGRVDGFTLAAAVGTLREAVQTLRAGGVDLVLLDLNLPDGHGLDVVRSLRAAAAPVDVIAVTAARELPVVRAAVSLGVVHYLLKPFVFADLRERLDAYREFRRSLTGSEPATQTSLDNLLGTLRRSSTGKHLPKGLSQELLDKVVVALRERDGASASEVADVTGASRVTARRYLEYLVESGQVRRGQRLGGTGRPEVLFSWLR